MQDHQGYVWMATQGGGANRFDGKSVEHFTKSKGLSSNFLTFIFETKSHAIWFASENGATLYQQGKFSHFGQKEGLCDGVVYALCEDYSGTLWFATQTEGIRSYANRQFKSFTTENGLPSNTCFTLQSFQNKLWIGTDNGIALCERNEITTLNYPDAQNKGFFSSCKDQVGNLWFGATDGTLIRISKEGKPSTVALPALVKSDFIGGMSADKTGNLWLATNHGLLKASFDGLGNPSFRLFGKREGLSVETVQTVLVDYENVVWSGTYYGGVNILPTESFGLFNENQGLPATNCTALLPFSSNQTLVGTTNGLFLYQSNETHSFDELRLGKNFESLAINDMAWSPSHELWLAEQNGVKVFKVLNQKGVLVKEIKDSEGKDLISPQKIRFDKKGNAWIANYGLGLTKVTAKGKTIHYTTTSGFPTNNVLTVFIDKSETVWVGTHDKGLIRLDMDGGVHLIQEMNKESVWSLAEDGEGNLYAGTADHGLFRKAPNQSDFKAFLTTKQGLKSNYIPALVYDSLRHCLWLGGEEGFSQFGLAKGKAKLKNYGESDGFKPVTINPNGLFPSEQGLFLGSVNGLVQFKLGASQFMMPSLKVAIKSIRVNNLVEDLQKYAREFDPSTKLPLALDLPYFKNNLSFEINAFSSQKVLFQYKLEGQDADWTAASAYPSISYTNLKPGKTYLLQVKCFRESNPVEFSILSFPVTIQIPWWETKAFIVFLFLTLLVLVILFIRYRVENLKRQNLVLETTVKERTEEIRTQKEKVEQTLGEKEQLLKDKEVLLKEIHHRVKNNLQTISSLLMLQANNIKDETAKKAIQESQTRVRSIALLHQKLYQSEGLESVDFAAFVDDLTQQLKPIFQDKTKQIDLVLELEPCFLLIDKAIPLGLIVNEWITNSYKYAFNERTEGVIRIQLRPAAADTNWKWILTYQDSGPGFREELLSQSNSSLGLRLIRLLSQQLGAELGYQQKPSIFTIQFK